MKLTFPALNLKTKLVAIMVVLLALTLGAAVTVSLRTQAAIVSATEVNFKELASAIQISVRELTAVGKTDHDRLQNYLSNLRSKGIEVSIASSENLIINSSNPRLVGAALKPRSKQVVITERLGRSPDSGGASPGDRSAASHENTIYQLIPVVVEDHLMGYVEVIAEFGDFTQLINQNRTRLITLFSLIFAFGIMGSYILADRYTRPIYTVVSAAQNIAARGLEPITEIRRRDEIGLLTRSFNEMVSQLRRARERELDLNRLERFTALGQLAGGLAHEIKNPLNFISLAVDQLRTRYGPQIAAEREHFLRQISMIKDEIHRLSGLIQNFLHYGKPIEIHPTSTDLRKVVRDVLALSDSRLRSQGIEVTEQGQEVPVVLSVDSEKIRTCFVNVVANATQAMPNGGQLTVGFERRDGHLVVSFTDTGEGIEPSAAAHVFEPFFTTKREGIGIGLFLSKSIVEKHGGTITIGPNDSKPGTTVTFSFPSGGVHKES
jgi:signal transduction histidine kinase